MHGIAARAAGRRARSGFILGAALATALALGARPAHAGFLERGLRWIAVSSRCAALPSWTAERLFRSAGLPVGLTQLCRYTWVRPRSGADPGAVDVAAIAASGATEVTVDVPVVVPMSPQWQPEEEALFGGLRVALRQRVGDASLLPAMPATPRVRIAVIDTAPDAGFAQPTVGESRHGDTLVQLIEDVVCRRQPCLGGVCDDGSAEVLTCAAEVTTELALPWLSPGVRGSQGGHIGTLIDLAQAIDRALWRWTVDRQTSQATPPRLVLNLSVGWEDLRGVADCNTGSPDLMAPPARAVLGLLQHAAAAGALIVAAAGNDSAGPTPRTGLVCPGRYQGLARVGDPARSLLVAVSGVDYADRPLLTARPLGITGISALGAGGVAWRPGVAPPPQLVGSSVATAVVAAVGALVWSQRPSWTASQISDAIYRGGQEVGIAADHCPLSLAPCSSRRAAVCGALLAAGVGAACVTPAPTAAGWPQLTAELQALNAADAGVGMGYATPVEPLLPQHLPHVDRPTVAAAPWTFPTPISATCPTCRVGQGPESASELFVPALPYDISRATLVVQLHDGHAVALELHPGDAPEADVLSAGAAWRFAVPQAWSIRRAYLTGLVAGEGTSFLEQVLVQP